MELTDTFEVSATASQVWELFWDLPRVARCLPGFEEIHAVDETHYRARMVQRVGPFQVAMDLDLAVQEIAPGQRVVVTGGGKDRMGNTLKLNRLAIELAPVSDERTEVSYSIDFNLFGRLATMGNAVMKRKAEETRAEFSRRIVQQLEGAGA